ncbi:transport Sec24A-like isoform X1 [Brachionus plicatilis]|uniref:Transport Sec24A-like isoform X1 n=1 Tax=Brachionus plicatilis TaxID=10195 RepID=A0A3M7QLL6_BRAPC|nr:transport Sec24A-like isoform X1 [Brachionus plicatilis]
MIYKDVSSLCRMFFFKLKFKNLAFKFGSGKLDERIYAMNLCKTLPLKYLMLTIYPNLYAIHNLDDKLCFAP